LWLPTMLHVLGLEEDNDNNFEAKRCLIKRDSTGSGSSKKKMSEHIQFIAQWLTWKAANRS
jgi:hypothetical protein